MTIAKGATVTVHVPDNLNLEQCKIVLSNVLKRTGHPTCCSGFNISFGSAAAILAVDPDTLELRETVR